MSDIRLYTLTNIYEGRTKESEFMTPTPLADTTTSEVETICGKVVKYLLTTKGSDFMAPEYGAYLTTHTQISEAYIPRLHIELLEDLKNCTAFITRSEEHLTGRTEKLFRINLVQLKYNTDLRTRIDLYIEVITTSKIKALLTIPVDL